MMTDPTTNKKGGRLYYLCSFLVSYRQDLEQLSGAFRRSVNKRAPDITDILRYFYLLYFCQFLLYSPYVFLIYPCAFLSPVFTVNHLFCRLFVCGTCSGTDTMFPYDGSY
jgi:hypothetical protein